MSAGIGRENSWEEFRTIIRDLEQRLVQQEFEHIAAPDIDDERHPRLDRRDIREVLLSGFSATSSIRFLTVNAAVFYERGCQEKHFPTDGPPGRKTYRGSQPRLR